MIKLTLEDLANGEIALRVREFFFILFWGVSNIFLSKNI